jgi:hypothetical protein
MSTLDYDISRVLTAMHLVDTHHHTWMVAAFMIAAYTLVAWLQHLGGKDNRSFWNSHQWAGPQNRLFPRTRAGIDAIHHTCEVVGKGYVTVCYHS